MDESPQVATELEGPCAGLTGAEADGPGDPSARQLVPVIEGGASPGEVDVNRRGM
jgi:hypothetical protein